MIISKKNISYVIDCLTYPVMVLDTDGMLLVTNKKASALLNQPVGLGSFIWEIDWWVKPESAKEKWRNACQSVKNGNRIKFAEPVRLLADRQVEVIFTLSPMLDNNDVIPHLFVELNLSSNSIPKENSPSHRSAEKADQLENPNPVFSETTTNLFESDTWESERKFRLMVESIEDYAMFMVDLEGFITSWNRGAERLTGYSDVEAIGRHFSMLYPQQSPHQQSQNREDAAHELAMAHANGRYEVEGIRVRKNGSQYHAQIIVWRIEDTAGNTIGFAKITRDVSALKEARLREAQLFESENQFRLMVDSIQDYAMFMVDPKGIITTWNRGAERITGYGEQEAVGRPFSILYPRSEISDEHAIYELTMAREKGFHEEEGIRVKKDGSLYHAQIVVWPIKDKAGDIVRFAKITRDITARKQAEHALQESEAKFRTMANVMPQIVWSAPPDGRTDYLSQQWYEFSGAKINTEEAQHWVDFIHPEEREQIRAAWQNCVTEKCNFEAQFRLQHHSGTYRWTLCRALPVMTDNHVTRWMGTLTDIHEQKRAESMLHESARRKDEYLAMLAHELRNPLAPIRNSTMLLRRISNDTQVSKAVNIIDRQVTHMTRLVDDLLDVARISRGKIELRRETFEFGGLIQHAINDIKPEYDIKGIELIVNMPSNLIWVNADYTRITQAIGNLLHNALKFTDPPGKVSISLTDAIHEKPPVGIVTVKDDGAGIDPQLLEQLFEPFVQGHQDLARTKGGLGLGLALIKGFATLHGGSVTATSQGVGHGAEFKFIIPLVAPVKTGHKYPSTGKSTMSLNIVLIDDNPDMVETLANLLSIEGHFVTCAYDGESGLKLIKTEKPDLVFCDIGLPGEMDGYAVAQHVRADNSVKNTSLIALTGYGQESDRKSAFAAGFDDHLVKPIDFRALFTLINTTRRKI